MNALKAGLVATVVAGSVGIVTTTTGCEGTAQARPIFMARDGQGYRPRDTFYPDTTTISCDVWFAASNNDETVDVAIVQTKGEDPLYSGTGVNEGPSSRSTASGPPASRHRTKVSASWASCSTRPSSPAAAGPHRSPSAITSAE